MRAIMKYDDLFLQVFMAFVQGRLAYLALQLVGHCRTRSAVTDWSRCTANEWHTADEEHRRRGTAASHIELSHRNKFHRNTNQKKNKF